ncbi:MAG TPA: hypothetical protein ACFYD1_09795, partial [Candidatus Hypogeohydataceae bacterium YC38]
SRGRENWVWKVLFQKSLIRKGKHIIMSDGEYFISLPHHKRINPYTLKAIIEGAGLTDKEFKALL